MTGQATWAAESSTGPRTPRGRCHCPEGPSRLGQPLNGGRAAAGRWPRGPWTAWRMGQGSGQHSPGSTGPVKEGGAAETPQATSPPWGSALDLACESTASAGQHPPLRLGLTRNSGRRRGKATVRSLKHSRCTEPGLWDQGLGSVESRAQTEPEGPCAGGQVRVARQPGKWGLRGGAPRWRDTGQAVCICLTEHSALCLSHPRGEGTAMAKPLPVQAWAQAGCLQAHTCPAGHVTPSHSRCTNQAAGERRQASHSACSNKTRALGSPPCIKQSHVRLKQPQSWLLHSLDPQGN